MARTKVEVVSALALIALGVGGCLLTSNVDDVSRDFGAPIDGGGDARADGSGDAQHRHALPRRRRLRSSADKTDNRAARAARARGACSAIRRRSAAISAAAKVSRAATADPAPPG